MTIIFLNGDSTAAHIVNVLFMYKSMSNECCASTCT